MSELLPCPFCGATDGRLVQSFTRATDDFAYWSVECLDCACEIADDESQDAADAAWNRRSGPTPPAAASEEVREALHRMVYETTHLSPCKPNGDHDCIIKAETLAYARSALDSAEVKS